MCELLLMFPFAGLLFLEAVEKSAKVPVGMCHVGHAQTVTPLGDRRPPLPAETGCAIR